MDVSSLRVPADSALARVATAAARADARAPPCYSGSTAAGVARHNPIRRASADGRRAGLSGRLPKSPPCSIQGLGLSSRCYSGSTARRSCRTAARRRGVAPQGVVPRRHLQQPSHTERGRDARSAAATVAMFAVGPSPVGRTAYALRRPYILPQTSRGAEEIENSAVLSTHATPWSMVSLCLLEH